MRDDFAQDVKRTLAARVAYLCSNPDCRAQTSGPQDDPLKAVNLGVAAHITAASKGGPRYSPVFSPEMRRNSDNGIWLCQNCAKLVDSDVLRFNETLLQAWKLIAEDRARDFVGKTARECIQKRSLPVLELHLECQGFSRDTYSPRTPIRSFVLGITNIGCGIAKFPSIRYRRASGLVVDHFGIDGCFGFGLPRTPSEKEWENFRASADQVIHPGETLKITKLLQRGQSKTIDSSQWMFNAATFRCEISAEEIPTITAERDVPEQCVTCSY